MIVALLISIAHPKGIQAHRTWRRFDRKVGRQLQSAKIYREIPMPQASFNPPWFVRKDLDGFFGLMIDNLIQLILIVSFCRELIHLPDDYTFGRILPGAAISI